MNKLSFLIVFLFSAICKGQGLTYNELRYVLIHDFDNCSRYLADSGFHIQKLGTPAGNYPEYFYRLIKDKDLNYISVEKKSYETDAFTYSQAEYLYLKKSIEDLGFKLDSTEMIIGRYPMYFYHKANLQISFVSELIPNTKNIPNGDRMIYGYYISLSDIEIKKKHNPMNYEW